MVVGIVDIERENIDTDWMFEKMFVGGSAS